jgi:3,4-dihydroxy 2-butanone 4-phosphate synthase/GTP cyclohydrolase II
MATTAPSRPRKAAPAKGTARPAAGNASNGRPAARRGQVAPSAVRVAAADLPTAYGRFRIIVYRDVPTGKEHAALVMGDVAEKECPDPVLVRIHSECLTGDIFGSQRCDCGPQLQESLRRIAKAGRGALLYLRQEGRDIGLTNKILAYELQEQGLDTVEANLQLGHPVDARTYDAARDILRDLGVHCLRLLTNNPDKIQALEGLGFRCVERIPIEIKANPFNQGYLDTKRTKMGHLLGGSAPTSVSRHKPHKT